MRRKRRRDRAVSIRGLTLTELLFAIGFIPLAMMIEARLFRSSMRVIETAPQTHFEHARLDRMSAMLRADAWGAATIQIPDGQTINLTGPTGEVVRWKLEETQAVRRAGGGVEQRWPLPAALRAEQQGAVVILSGPNDAMRFVSQQMILSKSGNP
jgi:hypothetical protein